MLRPSTALIAALVLSGCAGADGVARRELELLRGDLEALRQENAKLVRSVSQLATRFDALSARTGRTPVEPARGPSATGPVSTAEPASVPDGLAVVRMEPPRAGRAPPVPTSTALVEPDSARLEAIARKSGRDLAGDAGNELKAARRREPLARAHALEDFVARYPRHPQAGGALLEASAAYDEVGKADAACTLARRLVDEYPASEPVSEALLRLAACEGRTGGADLERRLLARIVNDFPGSPAARQARQRLAQVPGRPVAVPSSDGPARSGP
jgi:TolA-binding protein